MMSTEQLNTAKGPHNTESKQVFRHGLLGYPLGHSLSPLIHESLMAAAGIKGTYELIEIAPENLEANMPKLFNEFDGFNITIPHKEAVIPFLTGLDISAAEFGAVNTVSQRRGFNTDRIGFRREQLPLAGRRVLVTGAGGVARTMVWESRLAGGDVWIASRTNSRSEKLASELGVKAISLEALSTSEPFDVILNGTPAGMWPHTGVLPLPEAIARAAGCLYDTIYNPLATKLLLVGHSLSPEHILADLKTGDSDKSATSNLPRVKEPIIRNGLGMLFEQALAAQQIWHPDAVFTSEDQAAIRKTLPGAVFSRFPIKIILNGFMGSGKSTIGKGLADRLKLPFIDLDATMERTKGQSIPEIFADQGEPWFRAFERQTLEKVLNQPGSLVLSVGGGALVEPETTDLLRAHPTQTVFLHVPIAELSKRLADGAGRPMLDGDVAQRTHLLYEKRLPSYIATADLSVNAAGDEAAVIEKIVCSLGLADI